MPYRSYDGLNETPNASLTDAGDGCYAFSPSCRTASSYVSVMDHADEFDCHAPIRDRSTPLRPTLQSMDCMLSTRATTDVSSASAVRPSPTVRCTQRQPANASTDRGCRATQNVRAYGPIDDVVASPSATQGFPRDVALSPRKLGSDNAYRLRDSPISSIDAGFTPVDHRGVTAGKEYGSYPSDDVRVFRPTVNIGGTHTFAVAAVTTLSSPSLSSASLPVRTEGSRRPPSSSTPPTSTFVQTCANDVAALRSHLNALLRQQALVSACGAPVHYNGAVSEADCIGDRSSGPPPSSLLRRSGSDSALPCAVLRPSRPSIQAAHLQARTSQDLERPSAEAPLPAPGPQVSSFLAPSLVPGATPTLDRASELFLRSIAGHQQLPQPPLMGASEGAAHVAGASHSSRVNQHVRQARAQQAFDTQASELEQQLDERLTLVFTLMRRVMVLDARLAAGLAATPSSIVPSSGADPDRHRELLVRELEESEDATVSTLLRFVRLASRHALEWMNRGQYSAALQLLQQTDRLLSKDVGRVFRYVPDLLELDGHSFSGVAGGCTGSLACHDTAPRQQPAAASAQARSHDMKGPAVLTANVIGARANHIRSANNVRSMSVPFFSPSQELLRLEAVAAVEHNLGVYHFKLGEYTLASARFARSAALEEELRAPGIGITYFNMAQTQHGLQQLAEALQYAEMAEEAVERQVFVAKDKATKMRRRLTQGRAFQVMGHPDGAYAAGGGGEDDREEDAAAARMSAGGPLYGDAAANTDGKEEKALMRMWLEWRENVCFLSHVKQKHADWLDEMGLYQAAYQHYQQAHNWLLAVPRLAPEEQQRAQSLRQCMTAMKKRWRREELEVELYHHPLRRSSAATSEAGPAVSHPSHTGRARASSKHRARMHQRPQRSPGVFSAAAPVARDLTSPLQATIVTSVLPRTVEVIGKRPLRPSFACDRASCPTSHEATFRRSSATTFVPQPLASVQTRSRPSSASAAFYSAYGPRRPSVSSLPHRHGIGGHATAAPKPDCPHLTHPPLAQREPPPLQRRGERPLRDPSMRVPIPPPGRRTRHHTSTERDGSAAPGRLPRRSSAPLSKDKAGEPGVFTTAHLPPRSSSTYYDAGTRFASQYHHSPPHELEPTSSTSVESCVLRSLLFEAKPETPKMLPHHCRSEPFVLDELSVKSMTEAAAVSSAPWSESAATPKGESAGAGVSDLVASTSSAAVTPPDLTPCFTRIPDDLTWCATVLQAFLRPLCRHRTLLGMEVGRDHDEHTARCRDALHLAQASCQTETSTVKHASQRRAADVVEAVMLDGDDTPSDAQPRSLSPKSVASLMAPQGESRVSQPFGVGLSGILVTGAVGSVSCSTSAVHLSSLAASSSSFADVVHTPGVERHASRTQAAAAGEEGAIADARLDGEGACIQLAAVEHELSTGTLRGGVSERENEGIRPLGDECGREVAVAAIVEWSKSLIPCERADEGTRGSSVAEEPFDTKSPGSFHDETFHDLGDSVAADASAATGNCVMMRKHDAATAAASAPSSMNRGKVEREMNYLPDSSVADDAVAFKVELLGLGQCSRTPASADALTGSGGASFYGAGCARTSTANTHDIEEAEHEEVEMPTEERENAPSSALVLEAASSVPKEAELVSFNPLPQLDVSDEQGNVVAFMEAHAHEEGQHLACAAEQSGPSAQRIASPSRTSLDEVLRAERPEPTHDEAAVADALSAHQSTGLRKVLNLAATLEDSAGLPASAAEDNGDVPKPPSPSPASSAARIGRRTPSLSPPGPEGRGEGGLEAVPPSPALSPSSHPEESQVQQEVSQCVDEAYGADSAGLGAACETKACDSSEAAHMTLSDRSREDDVGDRTGVREGILSDSPPPLAAFSASAEDICCNKREDTVLRGGSLTRASVSAAAIRFTADLHEARQPISSSASVCTVNLETEGGNGPVSDGLQGETEEEEGDALPNGSEAVRDEEASSTEREKGTTVALAASVASPTAEAQEQLASPAANGSHPPQHGRAATLFSLLPSSENAGPSRGDFSETPTRAASAPHDEGAGLQMAVDHANTKSTEEKRSAEAAKAVGERRPAAEVEVAPQPLAASPRRRGRVFIFVAHKMATPVSMELRNVYSSVRSDDAGGRIRLPTRTLLQPAAILNAEVVEDEAAKSLLALAGGSRTTGSPDAPLSFKEEYCCAVEAETYATTEDETLGRHTASIGSTTTQITQLRESFWRSIHDRSEFRPSEGGSTVINAQRLLGKVEVVELAKVRALGLPMGPSTATMQSQLLLPSALVDVAGASEALVSVGDDFAKAEDKDVQHRQAAQQDLLSNHEIDIVEDVDTPPQHTASAPQTLAPLGTIMSPCLLPVLTPIAASATAVSVEAPREPGFAAQLEMTPSTAASLPVSLPPESLATLPEVAEASAGLLSPRNSPLDGERDLLCVGHGGGDIGEAVDQGDGEGLAVTEGEEGIEEDTSPPATEVKNVGVGTSGNAWVRSEGAHDAAMTPHWRSAGHPLSTPLSTPFYKLQPQRQRLGTNKFTWGDAETDEAQRRYIRDQIVQEEAATVIQQAWRDCAATRRRRQLYLLL
ncbi:hypothetical_protein [Leishmania braziliensis MHOM/BR/75/M2904]|uniref:Hypothetical_protein n=1 Tax=Leishmania braziliensis MHOM/BR/75/M2904 TaxID=420245 RepID=A0A3P3ZFF0_LEIBR|nr:hypothetical_protein [Leishmania braziliensis MHOM/BR/75/M2904]